MAGVRRSRAGRAAQKGYALLMALFLVATMIIMATVVTPSVLTEGRREREQETIWRGNEYVRAIQLYYKKTGRYPQTVDDLIKGNLSVHFIRKAYTDPMNTEDGSWRFIYVSASGQLIGSVRYHSLQEMALMLKMPGAGQAFPAANGQPANGQQAAAGQGTGQPGAGQPGAGQSGAGGADQQQSQAGQPGAAGPGQQSAQGAAPTGGGQAGSPDQQQGFGQGTAGSQGFAPTQGAFASSFSSTGQAGAAGAGAGASSFGAGPSISTVPLQAVEGPVLGASLIGVASKVKRSSLIVYQGGKTYFEWEFIYNPLAVATVPGQPGGAATPTVAPPGQNGPAGTAAPTGFSPSAGGANQPLGLPPATSTP